MWICKTLEYVTIYQCNTFQTNWSFRTSPNLPWSHSLAIHWVTITKNKEKVLIRNSNRSGILILKKYLENDVFRRVIIHWYNLTFVSSFYLNTFYISTIYFLKSKHWESVFITHSFVCLIEKKLSQLITDSLLYICVEWI